MATYSSILAWKIPRAEEPGRLQSMGLQRVGQDRAHVFLCSPNNVSPSGQNLHPLLSISISWQLPL